MSKTDIKYTGYGACRTVPGSRHCFSIGGKKYFVDFGKKIDDREEAAKSAANGEVSGDELDLGFNVSDISAIVETHAHADHILSLFDLLFQGRKEIEEGASEKGLEARIYSTKATRDLARVQLGQSVPYNSSKTSGSRKNPNTGAKQRNKQRALPANQSKQEVTVEDVSELLRLFVPSEYRKEIPISPNVKATFYDAGHILGSAQVLLDIDKGDGLHTKILLTGDLGRRDINTPILKYPDTDLPKDIDYIFIESTYGNRKHDNSENSKDKLEKMIQDAYSKKSKIICGAFSIQRTQMLLENLFELYKENRLPKGFRIYLDSPTARKVNEAMLMNIEDMDDEGKAMFRQRINPFNFPVLQYIDNPRDSWKLTEQKGPYMVIAAHGMYSGGRVMRHLANAIENPNNIVLITGYQAPGTLGAKLEEGSVKYPEVEIEVKPGEIYKCASNARVERMRGLSGHGDYEEMIAHVVKIADPKRLKGIFVNHGDEEGSLAIAQKLREIGFNNVVVPYERQEYALE